MKPIDIPAIILLCLCSRSACGAPVPAARQHVRLIDGKPWLFTSKLRHVVEFRFSLLGSHPEGMEAISFTLARIAANYGVAGADAFTIRRFPPSQIDDATYAVPDFTGQDLLDGDVIVANNASDLGNPSLGETKREAIRYAVETAGRGFLAIHGTAEYGTQRWDWLDRELLPIQYAGHSYRTALPTYKNRAEAAHIVLENVLETRLETGAWLSDGLDSLRHETFAQFPHRKIISQIFNIRNDFCREEIYRERCSLLLKMDYRYSDAPTQYIHKQGNPYSWILKVGAGLSGYIHGGHQTDETTLPGNSFDGGAGDWDRYIAQTLFFLAGYRSEPCDSRCDGLPMVDSANHLMHAVYSPAYLAQAAAHAADARLDPGYPAFIIGGRGHFRAELTDVRGRRAAYFAGTGPAAHRFPTGFLAHGIYFLRVTGPRGSAVRRYLVGSPSIRPGDR